MTNLEIINKAREILYDEKHGYIFSPEDIGIIGAALGIARILEENRLEHEQWGAEGQTKMLFEEMAEWQNAICKHSRGLDSVEHIAEEIAGVQIMLEQMTVLSSIEAAVVEYLEQKLSRLADRLDKEC